MVNLPQRWWISNGMMICDALFYKLQPSVFKYYKRCANLVELICEKSEQRAQGKRIGRSFVLTHHTRFPLCTARYWKTHKMSTYFLLSSNHSTKLHLSDKNISTHMVKIFNLSMKLIKCPSMFFSIPRSTKRKPRGVAQLCTYRCVPRLENPLYIDSNGQLGEVRGMLALLGAFIPTHITVKTCPS